jgi:VIT1/CCC1 family predicted Fe2+/Mn2+ transporter
MRSFIQRHLEPADILGEALFGLIMALGFTAAVRLGQAEADNRALFISILGCNLAWAIVDGVTYVLGAHFERGRLARMARDVLATPPEADATRQINDELASRLGVLASVEQRNQVAQWALENLRRNPPEAPRLQRGDVLAGVAIALLILLATLPVVVPYLVAPDAFLAVRLSNLIALTELFLLGIWWGRVVGQRPLAIAATLTLIGVALVLMAIALGG